MGVEMKKLVSLAGQIMVFLAISASHTLAKDWPASSDLELVREQEVAEAQRAAAARSLASAEIRTLALGATPRARFRSDRLEGSVNLVGGKLDDLVVLESDEMGASIPIRLLNPRQIPSGYFVEHGLVAAADNGVDIPDAQTVWSIEHASTFPTVDEPLVLRYENGSGLVFWRSFFISSPYLVTVVQTVSNNGAEPIELFAYARVGREGGRPEEYSQSRHEGPIGVLGSQRPLALSYAELEARGQIDQSSGFGWLGFADAAWLVAVMPEPERWTNSRFAFTGGATPMYQANYVELAPLIVRSGMSGSVTGYVYAGLRDDSVIDAYEDEFGFSRFGFAKY
jgi:YidC/Oxa1 family membrane protein insertase